MARKLYIAELEFQLDIQDASVWTPEFQQKLIESIQSAFENINIPEGLELGFLEYIEWDFGTLNSIDQMPFKIQTYLNESWHQFTTADTKTAQTVIHRTTAGVPQFPSETDELDWITHHGQPQGPQSFFSFPAQNRASMNIPIAFFTQIWKQYVQGQSHIGLGNTMEMLRFLGLSTTLQNRFKSWFIVQPVTQQQQFLKTTFMSMSNSQYENFQYDDWLAFLFQTSFNSDIFAILRLPQKMALKADLLRWLALQKNQTAIRSETITNTPYFDQSNTTTQNRITDSQGKQKTTPTTQNRIANSTNKEISSNQIKNVDASLLNAESDAFWLQNISFEWSNLQAAAVLPLSAHLELLTVWEKTLKSWHTPKTNPFILWFFRQRESFSQPGAFRKIILEILKWTRNSPSESTELVPQDALFEYLNPQLPAAIIFSWEAHITAGEPQTTLPQFWSQFTPFLNNIAIKNAAANSHLDQEHPLYAFTHTNRLETLLSSNFNAYLNPATRKIWQELHLIYEYIQNQYENSETTAAYIHLFLVPNIRTLIETWLQLIQLSEPDRYLSDPINISANQTSENSGDLESDTADVKLQTRTDDALNNQRNLDTGKLEVGPNTNSADAHESQRNLETDTLEVGPNNDSADALESQRNLETDTLELGPNNNSADGIESQRNIDTDKLELGPSNDSADALESQRNLERDKLELEAALAERLKLQSQEQLESFQIFQDISPNTDDWNKNALEAWIEWQKSILAETESEQNQPQNLHQRINEFINLWKSTQALGRDRIPTEIGPIQEHHSFSFFLSHIHYQIGTLSQLVQVTLSQHPYVDIAAFENTTKELQKVQNQIRELQQLQIKNFASDARSKAWNLELTLLLNQAFVWLYAFESPQLFLGITNEIIIAWNRIYAQSKSQQTASISESNIPINESNFPINDSNIPINESNFPINESNFPINDSNIPINGIIPIDPLPLPIRDVFSSDNDIFDPFTTPSHIFQGVEMDWRSIDDLLESFEIHLLTVLPSAPKMPNSKWLRWTEQVHPITLTHWYRIEYIKRLLADSKSNAAADPIIQLASFSRFIETLLETPFHSFIVPNNIALEVVEDWRNYLSQLVQLRSNLWKTKSTLDGDREWLQLQSETARIRLTENTVESRQRKPLSASSTVESSDILERTADSKDNAIDTENRESNENLESSESLQSNESLESSESLQSNESLESSDPLKRPADSKDNAIDTENRKSNESLEASDPLKRPADSNVNAIDTENRKSTESLDSSDPLKRNADSKYNAIDTENRESSESLDSSDPLKRTADSKDNAIDTENRKSNESLEASDPLKRPADSKDNAIESINIENREADESLESNKNRESIERLESSESLQSNENLDSSDPLKRTADSNVNAIDTENRESSESLESSDPLKRTADSNDNAMDAENRKSNESLISSENRKSNESLDSSDPLKRPADSNVNTIDTENRKSTENLDSSDPLNRPADSKDNAIGSINIENRKSNESLQSSDPLKRTADSKYNAIDTENRESSESLDSSDPLKRTADSKDNAMDAENRKSNESLDSSDPLKRNADSKYNAIDTENRKSSANLETSESLQSSENLEASDPLKRSADSNINAIDAENRKSKENLEASNPLKRTNDSKETSPEANNTENSQTLIEPQSFYSRKIGINPQQEDRILPFEIQKIAYSDAVKSIYFWLPLLGFETPYLIPADNTSEALVPENEQIKNDSATPFAETLRNTLEQLRRDPQKHLWYAELRKQKGRAFYQLAEAMSVAEVLQWTNSSYSYQWSFTENDAEKLQQFIRQEFGISATFKFTHYIKYRLILINKPQTRLDMALLLIEEISIRSGGLDFKQAQRLLTLLKGILNLDNAEFNRLQDYYNETLTQQAPKASATTDFKNTPTITWTNVKQPPELGAWFQEFLFERPFISKESLRRQLELWADELFPNISAASKRSHIETWLSQELTRAAQIFRNAIEQKAPLNNPRIQWLIEHLVVYLTHQKTLPLFEEIRTKSQLSWTAITQSLSPQIRHTIAQKVPRIHPVLQQFAQDTIIQIEKQSAPNSLQPIADKAVQVVPLIPTLKPWLNPFTRGSIWFTLKKIISPNTFDPTNKPQRFNNPILRSIETLSAAFRETEMEQDLQQLLLELVAWILPLEYQDETFAARALLTDEIFEKIQETVSRADLDNAQMPQWLQRTLTQPQIWSSQWRRHFFDILEDLNQRNWGNPSETNVISIKNQRLSEAFQRFIWELNSPIYNESPHLGPYWLLSLHQIFDLTLDLPQSEVSSTTSATDENTALSNKEAPSNIPASIDITTDNARLDAEKLLIPNAVSTRILAEKTQNEIERLRLTRHVFWDTNELVLTTLWGSFRTALLRQWSEQLKNTVPSETHSINLWTEKWLIPVKGDVTEWILNHSLSPLLRWSKMAGWSANSNFIGVQRMLLLLVNPPEIPIRLEQMSTSELALDYEGNPPMEQIQQQLKQVESKNVQTVEQRIALTWQREGLSEIAIDTLLSAKGVGLLENPINAGLQLETSPKEQKVNNQVKRDIEKGVRFKTQFCGLMMIAPFYATLFKRLNLMEGQQFISDAHQITAYQVILYITEMDAENTFTEVQDLIPRIIVGLAPERELFLENPLTEESKNEAKRFMGAIKMQWPLMANVSLRGFIESFLLRGGLAWKGADDSWNVEVEGMGSDIIMQTLPWGYATMKFPWTGYLIYTTWKAP